MIRGREAKTGMPRELPITSTEVLGFLTRPAKQIIDGLEAVMENTSPELIADIAENGIVLTGGGAQIYGMDKLIAESTGIHCTLADDAASCVAYGCGKSLSWINHMQEGPINLARKRLMRK